jgi:hypothetical protein
MKKSRGNRDFRLDQVDKAPNQVGKEATKEK